MPEIGTSGSMSGDGKRSVGHRPQATAPILDSTITLFVMSPRNVGYRMKSRPHNAGSRSAAFGRFEMWRGGCRSDISVSAPFVWRCLSGSTVTPFPHPAHRNGRADFPHPALGQD